MIKINREIADLLLETNNRDNIGIYCEQGAVIGDCEFVIVINEDGQKYLAHISDFEQDGVLIRLKNEK